MFSIIPLLAVTSICVAVALPNKQIVIDQVSNVAASAVNGKSDFLGNVNKQLQIPNNYPDFKQYGRQEAVLEQEHWLSKKDSPYEKTQIIAARYLGIKPLVDTIQEHEKYGNSGEKRRNFAKILVNGFDSLGNVINSIVDLPFKAKNNIGRTVTAALDAIGAKLVGI